MNTSFMIGCHSKNSYSKGQVIYNNPANNEKSFIVCEWDNSLANKYLDIYSKKYNTTYVLRVNDAGEVTYTIYDKGIKVANITLSVVSGYLICNNVWQISNPYDATSEDGSLQITKITIDYN